MFVFGFALVERGVLPLIGRAIVVAALARQFDSVDELDVRALVDVVRVAGGKVRDQESKWTAGAGGERRAVKLVDQQRAVTDRGQGHAGVKIIGRRMERQPSGRRAGADTIQQPSEANSAAAAFGIELVDVGDLEVCGNVGKRRAREPRRSIDFAIDLKS
jgi:hypothetical protein